METLLKGGNGMSKKEFDRSYRNYNNSVNEESVETSIVNESSTLDEAIEESKKVSIYGVVVGCEKLNVRKRAETGSPVLCVIESGSSVEVDKKESTKDFYKVKTSKGIEGFCMKKFVKIQY